MHRIEALEIDDQILDKIQTAHGVTFDEAEEAAIRFFAMCVEAARAYTRYSVGRKPDATCWLSWRIEAEAFGESSPPDR